MHFFTKIIDFVFPPRCLNCKKAVSDFGLCSACWKNIKFISKPWCAICSYPFEFETNEKVICGSCIKKKPNFDKLYSSIKYDDNSQALIHRFKFYDQIQLSIIFAKWMLSNIQEIIPDVDFIMPVPLSRHRLFTRRYNQSALLAKEIAKHSNLKIILSGLKKIKHTKPQSDLTKKQRLDNVKNAYVLDDNIKNTIKGKNILLVDDVFTTGATINECTNILKKAGCGKVFVITIARTVI